MTTTADAPEGSPFDSPSAYMSIPRVGGLTLSPAGDRLVASVAQLDGKGAEFVTSLWALDPAGAAPARQLTRSSKGESSAAYLPDGSLLFTSTRPGLAESETPEDKDDQEIAALWLLPAGGGDPWVVARRPGGVTAVATGRETTTVVVAAKSAPGAPSDDEDREWWTARRKRKVSAVLHEGGTLRHWDHHLGPDEVHLYAATVDPGVPGPVELRDLTPDAGQALHDSAPVLFANGTTVLVHWVVPLEEGRVRSDVVAIDVATGARRTLAVTEDGSFVYEAPALSPNGRLAVALRMSRPTITEPWWLDLWLIDLATGAGRALGAGDEPFVTGALFSADSAAVIATTDCKGHAPLYRIDVASGEATRLTGDGAWASPQVDPSGGVIYVLRASMTEPPRPVRLDLGAAGPAALTGIDAPGAIEGVPGRVEELTTEAADGTPLRAWLVLPEHSGAAAPAPLALWVHGGPQGSWNGWHWRWNPWLLAARGWAVLLPDPALSTGYGAKMIRRGWGQWGGAPYDDLMAVTDAALKRPDLDATRTAAMGGSYGGYMANWIAGHTERFSAIVSHASLWSLEQFQGTTDYPAMWADEWGYPDTNPELYRTWSPDRYADAITTPMLVIHGDHDYRCPVGESLRLWSDLIRRGVDARLLWFAAENHWVLQPGDGIVWYETVIAFLNEHVLGQGWERPSMV